MDKISYEFTGDSLVPAVLYKNGHKTPIWMQQRYEDGKYSEYVQKNGCGHCCSAMVLNLKGKPITPHEHIEHCVELWGEPNSKPSTNQQYYFLSVTGLCESLNSYGVKAKWFGHKESGVQGALNNIINSLKQGKMVIFISSPSKEFLDNPFSKGDHYVLAVGLTEDNKIIIANSSVNSHYEIGEGIQICDELTIKKSLNPIAEPVQRTWGEIVDLHKGIGYVVIE